MLQKVFYWGLPLKNLNTCSPKIFNVERNVGGSAQKEACYVLEKLCIYPLLSTVNTYLWIFRVHYRRLILFTVMTYLWCGKYLTFVYLALLSLCPVKFLAFLFNTRKKLASFCLSSHVCHTKHSRGTGVFPKIMFPSLISHLHLSSKAKTVRSKSRRSKSWGGSITRRWRRWSHNPPETFAKVHPHFVTWQPVGS